jgi:hypothetical protein
MASSNGQRDPFLLLHDWQAGRRFEGQLEPPRLSGFT